MIYSAICVFASIKPSIETPKKLQNTTKNVEFIEKFEIGWFLMIVNASFDCNLARCRH